MMQAKRLLNNQIDLHWQVGYHQSKESEPTQWIVAQVPGAVQLDVARSENYGALYYAENWRQYLWMEDVYWTYRTSFTQPALDFNDQLFFVSKGIDYHFDIFFNNELVHSQEGMFTSVRINLTHYIRQDNELSIIIHPIPKNFTTVASRKQADQTCKPAVSYGWDWHPRLVPSGIWDDTYLEIKKESFINHVDFDYELNTSRTKAELYFDIMVENYDDRSIDLTITDKDDTLLLNVSYILESEITCIDEILTDIDLWHPNGYGEPVLYTISVVLYDSNEAVLDEHVFRTGFRSISLVMNEDAWLEPSEFPKSQSIPPITLEVNGYNVFGKGSNWVPPDIFPGTITEDKYLTLLELARNANFNLLRVWGGGIVNKDSFFELCDSLGIMVWQEFPLSCNVYDGTKAYLSVLEQESESIIKRLKHHPCVALYCGGNELFNSWSGMTNQSLALRLLNSQCYRFDPKRPFIPTSPLMGMGHGHYVFRDMQKGEDVFQWMPRATNSAYTEFGVPAPAPIEVLKQIIPENELFPPQRGGSWESHHAFNAWTETTWLMEDVIAYYFGKQDTLEQLVDNGQLLQSQGYKCIFEEARRQKFRCSMALNWCFNEPWFTAAGNSLVTWQAAPKPAYFAVSESCRPVLASARIPKFLWYSGEEFTCEVWILNDSLAKVESSELTVTLFTDRPFELLTWKYPTIEANKNLRGPTARFLLPITNNKIFTLKLEIHNKPELSSTYTLLCNKLNQKLSQTPQLNL